MANAVPVSDQASDPAASKVTFSNPPTAIQVLQEAQVASIEDLDLRAVAKEAVANGGTVTSLVNAVRVDY